MTDLSSLYLKMLVALEDDCVAIVRLGNRSKHDASSVSQQHYAQQYYYIVTNRDET